MSSEVMNLCHPSNNVNIYNVYVLLVLYLQMDITNDFPLISSYMLQMLSKAFAS